MYNQYFNQPKTTDEIAFYIDLLYNTVLNNVLFKDGNKQNISYENVSIIDETIIEDDFQTNVGFTPHTSKGLRDEVLC